MTVQKKLVMSNVLMILIPMVLAMMFGIIAFRLYGERYWESLEEMYNNENGAVIKNTFDMHGKTCEIVAVCTRERAEAGHAESYLKKYIISFIAAFLAFVLLIVALTNFCLSRWIAHAILKPLKILKNGTREIANGNLDVPLEYEKYRRELIVGISHDLRTPLTSIKGYIEGLQDGIANTEEKRERYYKAIHTRAIDMEALVDSLSTFARLENKEYKYHLELVDLDAYIRQVIQEYGEEAKQKNAVIRYENDAKNKDVLLDVQEMHRVLVNLFENSIKYRTKEVSNIRIHVSETATEMKILVADDGPGVMEKELTEIFHTFYRGDESRTRPEMGSGLGLAIVKRIIEGHHGKIRAYNENGLVIEIILPKAEREGKGEEDGTEGMRLCREKEYNLILLDVMLPGISGFDICREVRKEKQVAGPIEESIAIRNLKIVPLSHRVYVNGKEVTMANREYELLLFLATNPNIVFSKEKLFERIWGMDVVGDTATVTVHVNRIREKIEKNPAEPEFIETIWGAGYRFNI